MKYPELQCLLCYDRIFPQVDDTIWICYKCDKCFKIKWKIEATSIEPIYDGKPTNEELILIHSKKDIRWEDTYIPSDYSLEGLREEFRKRLYEKV